MYLEINAKELVKVAKLCKKVIDKKSVLPVLAQIKVDVTSGKATFSCTNLETGLIINVDCVTEGQGSFLIPFKAIENLKPEGKIVVKYENSIEIKKDTGSVVLSPDNVEDFPVIETDEIKYDMAEDFLDKVMGCLPAVSTEESRYVLTGVCIQKDAIVGTDGRRMHVYETVNPDVFSLFNSSGIILPIKTIKLLNSIIKSEKNKEIRFGITGKVILKERGRIHPLEPELARPKIQEPNQMTFQVGNATLISKLIEGRYPKWKNVIPDEERTLITFDKNLLLTALQDSLNYTDKKEPTVMMYFNTNPEKKLDIYTDGCSIIGKFYTNIPIATNESVVPFGIGISSKYLLDALNVIGTEAVNFEFSAPLKPIQLKSTNGDKALYLVMPVRTEEPVQPYAVYCELEKQRETINVETSPDITDEVNEPEKPISTQEIQPETAPVYTETTPV